MRALPYLYVFSYEITRGAEVTNVKCPLIPKFSSLVLAVLPKALRERVVSAIGPTLKIHQGW